MIDKTSYHENPSQSHKTKPMLEIKKPHINDRPKAVSSRGEASHLHSLDEDIKSPVTRTQKTLVEAQMGGFRTDQARKHFKDQDSNVRLSSGVSLTFCPLHLCLSSQLFELSTDTHSSSSLGNFSQHTFKVNCHTLTS